MFSCIILKTETKPYIMKPTDLENRLIEFSLNLIELVDRLPASEAGEHLSGQLIRSGTATALIYGEARSAESPKDFTHKMQLILKELRECSIILRIIQRARLNGDFQKPVLDKAMDENNQLIAIFVTSVKTSKRRLNKIKR